MWPASVNANPQPVAPVSKGQTGHNQHLSSRPDTRVAQSLQEQLKALGLVDEKKAKKAEQDKRQKRRKKVNKAKQGGREATVAARKNAPQSRKSATAELMTRAERDRARERARRRSEERAALKAQIRQIIARRKKPRSDGEISYSFIDGRKVRSIYVTAALRDGLAGGRLEVVRLGEGFEVVDVEVAEKLRGLDSKVVVERRSNDMETAEAEYADHPIPDDLDW